MTRSEPKQATAPNPWTAILAIGGLVAVILGLVFGSEIPLGGGVMWTTAWLAVEGIRWQPSKQE